MVTTVLTQVQDRRPPQFHNDDPSYLRELRTIDGFVWLSMPHGSDAIEKGFIELPSCFAVRT
ncbi:hypothetical protein RE6C_02846 [Rhodopirellula europaea 6C]|uniref:Uncharacterized protein n=1 Tax=Rhodopirellula europaea 6C TaxID=1263867 RepID=M2A6M2_9BACT|nr:hypothetical protein RE6C_02846 [Rhodopirellula europaea 6C]